MLTRNALANALFRQREHDEAEALYRECLRDREALLGSDDVATCVTRSSLARLLQDTGRDVNGAVKLLRQSAAFDAQTQGPDAPYTLVTYSQLGGALTGFLFSYYYRQGKDISRGFDRLMDRIATWFKPRQHMKVTHKKSSDDLEYNKQKGAEQKEVDKILDKISKGGYDSLTAREKELLFKMSDKK